MPFVEITRRSAIIYDCSRSATGGRFFRELSNDVGVYLDPSITWNDLSMSDDLPSNVLGLPVSNVVFFLFFFFKFNKHRLVQCQKTTLLTSIARSRLVVDS